MVLDMAMGPFTIEKQKARQIKDNFNKNKQRFSVLIIFITILIGSHPTHCSYLHQYIYTLQAAVPDKELTATRHVSGLKRRNVLRSPLTLCCHMQFPVQIMNSLYI
jgi:hypothetical protein